MTRAAVLAFAGAAVGVAGVWEAAAAVERTRVAALGRALSEPLRRARDEGREPTAREQRRLVGVALLVLLLGAWSLAGPVAGVLAAAAAPALLRAAVRARRRRYTAELQAGAAPAARALADALGAGHSIRGAVAVAAPGIPGAAGRELLAAGRSLALGERTDDVLEQLRGRAAAPAWDTLIAATLLQRDAGGDLAALLRHLAGSLEQAQRQEAEARTATAQARFTAWLVAGMPLAAAGLAEVSSPGFLAGLAAQPLSAALAATALLFQLAALLAIRRLVRV